MFKLKAFTTSIIFKTFYTFDAVPRTNFKSTRAVANPGPVHEIDPR